MPLLQALNDHLSLPVFVSIRRPTIIMHVFRMKVMVRVRFITQHSGTGGSNDHLRHFSIEKCTILHLENL